MEIPFVTRSKFLVGCKEEIMKNRSALDSGALLPITLEAGVYTGHITVDVRSGAPYEFASDWEGSDWTRFPARIRAAATALRECDCFGTFVITHQDGSLSIRRQG